MVNLFIMHTQYNLILASIVANKFQEDENILVLYPEFAVKENLIFSLNRLFCEVIVLNDGFFSPSGRIESFRYLKACLKKTKKMVRRRIDHVFISQERVFEKCIYSKIKKHNKNAVCFHIEEDVYYSVNNKYNGIVSAPPVTFKKRLKNLLCRIALPGYSSDWNEFIYCYGMSRIYDGAYLLFPLLARRELQGKQLLQISKESLGQGIDSLYSYLHLKYPEKSKYTVIFFDLMNRYKQKELVKRVLGTVIQESLESGRTVLLKYHPRETEKFEGFSHAIEVDQLVPAEKVLSELQGRDVIVWGNATTSCIVAAKLGYTVNSICKIESPENIRMHEVMQNMGIHCIDSL